MKATYIDHMGTDLSVVNAARVSFGKRSDWLYPELQEGLDPKDVSLINFLARGCSSGDWKEIIRGIEDGILDYDHGVTSMEFAEYRKELVDTLNHIRRMPDHWTPFAATSVQLHIKAPIFVARQLGKHQIGMVWSEVSRRYVDDEPEFYVPDVWRKRSDNVKQGSSDEPSIWNHGMGTGYRDHEQDFYEDAFNLYRKMLDVGVCPEQARMILPQSMYTEWYWTGNLYSFANMYIQRTDGHAQKETQEIARQIGEIIEPLFPVSWAALTK